MRIATKSKKKASKKSIKKRAHTPQWLNDFITVFQPCAGGLRFLRRCKSLTDVWNRCNDPQWLSHALVEAEFWELIPKETHTRAMNAIIPGKFRTEWFNDGMNCPSEADRVASHAMRIERRVPLTVCWAIDNDNSKEICDAIRGSFADGPGFTARDLRRVAKDIKNA